MKILQISDTHWGITKEKTITRMLEKASKEAFDIILYCGDYCGGRMGHKMVRLTVEAIRKVFPNKPFISVLGNHDYWCLGNKRSRPSSTDFNDNYQKILDIFEKHNVHFLDEQGLFKWSDIIVFGHSGWYTHPNPPTNDQNFLPIGMEGDTNRFLLKKANDTLNNQLMEISSDEVLMEGVRHLCFVSHFPVVKLGEDYKGSFEDFSWSASLGEMLERDFGVKYFFEGHSHMLHNGPLKYNCGPDYYKPTYQIVEVK